MARLFLRLRPRKGKDRTVREGHSLAPGRPECPMKAESLKARGSRESFSENLTAKEYWKK